ncbi:Uncharacterised protein (plasmid) [Legionella adelaidensis]|uniref:Coiled-coil protein n=1 Tax=Legionella adelaidensis TaxID=45056 RepID=A0A0W0R437_9GAMM|nr:hypothetical protein [Legionella adelaidensis]KTC65821.1 hypothetical protein Lade_0479 [Legionella adelaidensis]VEH85250.1 Uncharacterised protein [Legionella adelaidensis]
MSSHKQIESLLKQNEKNQRNQEESIEIIKRKTGVVKRTDNPIDTSIEVEEATKINYDPIDTPDELDEKLKQERVENEGLGPKVR